MTQNDKYLWKREGFCHDSYLYTDHFQEEGTEDILLPLPVWLTNATFICQQSSRKIGIFIQPEEEFRPLINFLSIIPVIALNFPVFSDGRSYSKAVQLKTIYHYKGELRAAGNILIDHISQLLRCGFDTIEVSHPLTKERLSHYKTDPFPHFYQTGTDLNRMNKKRIWRFS